MKRIGHKVFADPEPRHPIWAWLLGRAERQRDRERLRQQAEAFINEAVADRVVSVTEQAPTLGPFSVVVWWYWEVPETATPVIRASGENQNARSLNRTG